MLSWNSQQNRERLNPMPMLFSGGVGRIEIRATHDVHAKGKQSFLSAKGSVEKSTHDRAHLSEKSHHNLFTCRLFSPSSHYITITFSISITH